MGAMEDRWRILYNEHTRAPIYTVSHYVAYLRRFVSETGGSQSSSSKSRDKGHGPRGHPKGQPDRSAVAQDGIDPLSYFLRKLKLDLKVSYDSFVYDFVRPRNDGLDLLLRLLTNLQSPQAGHNKSSSSLNRSTSRLSDYKKGVTDEHDCLLCIKFCLRVQPAVSQLVHNTEGLQRVATGVQGSSSKARITCLEILTLCLLDSGGVDGVVEAFTVLRLQTGQSVRFKMLVSMLHTRSPAQVLFQVTCLKFFNTLLNSCGSANQRVYLQYELMSAGLDLHFLQQCAEGDGLEYDDLRREIHEWRTRFIDVDALLKKLKVSQRDSRGQTPFADQEGPLQVSSRKGSVRNGHGTTFFQPGELDGTVQLGADVRRDFHRSNPQLSHNAQRSSNAAFNSNWQSTPSLASTTDDRIQNQVNGFGPDDSSDSDIVSVSVQQTPLTHRRSAHPADPHSNPSSGGSQEIHNFHVTRHNPAAHRDSKPPPYQQHRPSNGFVRTGAGAHERRPSTDSLLDPYGLIIHGHERRSRDDLGWDQGQGYGQGQGLEAPGPDVYSNWKLQYFSSPNIPQGLVSDRNGPGHHQSLLQLPGQLGDRRKSQPQFVGDVGTWDEGGEKPRGDGGSAEDAAVIWNSYYCYPFSKRALYRGHENGRTVAERGDTTLPVRGISTPPRVVGREHENGSKDEGGEASAAADKNDNHNKPRADSLVPEPDYTPLATPAGSVRSLNTEVARVLRDFENTLQAHDSSITPTADLGHVAFV